MKTHHEGLLLLGGRARRFGSNKMAAEVDGAPLYHRVYQALGRVCSHINVSVASHSGELPDPPWMQGSSWGAIEDLIPDQGPLGGIHSAFHERKSDLLVVAGDLPNLSKGSLDSILDVGRDSRAAIICARSRLAMQEQPLCGLWKQRVAPQLDAYLETGRRSVFGFLDYLEEQGGPEVLWVDVDDSELVNINRPGDLDLLTWMS
jgi:molybdopterin-guanine dinucleotide biosynthesis protein A